MPGRHAGLVSYISRLVVLAAALQPLAACQISPQWANFNLDSVQPAAIQEAQERARTYLACDKVTSEVLSRDAGDRRIGYGLNRSEFTIQTRAPQADRPEGGLYGRGQLQCPGRGRDR